jgi:hypothetical protein
LCLVSRSLVLGHNKYRGVLCRFGLTQHFVEILYHVQSATVLQAMGGAYRRLYRPCIPSLINAETIDELMRLSHLSEQMSELELKRMFLEQLSQVGLYELMRSSPLSEQLRELERVFL